ncbi:MAG: GGDEF domain-containing protein [Myxococcota bacterium]
MSNSAYNMSFSEDQTGEQTIAERLTESVARSRSPVGRPQPTLMALCGTCAGQIFILQPGVNLIGRDPRAAIILDSSRISRRHCEIIVPDQGNPQVRDLKSTNGTLLNDRNLTNKAILLRDGDQLRVGSVLLKFGFQLPLESELQQDLYRSAQYDALTGTFNKRHLLTRMDEEFAWARRRRQPLSMVIVDLDHFKSINDTYGHAVGDIVLKAAAASMRDKMRREDVLGRFGGEEFVILMRDTPTHWAMMAAERIRESIAREPIAYDDGVVWITCSAGVSSSSEDGISSVDALFQRADERLYAAKNAGRNRTFGPEDDEEPKTI